MIHAAHAIKDAEGFCFVSLDGDHYIGVNRFPEPDHEEDVQRLLDGAPDYRTKPMTVTRGFIEGFADEAEFFELLS